MSLPAGARLGHYAIVSPIGAGGMGAVYRAHDPRLGRDVAIKVLPAAFSDDPERLRRFEQEARAMYQDVVERSTRRYVPLIHLALGADVVGDREQAITLARRSFDEPEPAFFLLARYDSIHSTLRADARFAALVGPPQDTNGSIPFRKEEH